MKLCAEHKAKIEAAVKLYGGDPAATEAATLEFLKAKAILTHGRHIDSPERCPLCVSGTFAEQGLIEGAAQVAS